MRNAIFVPVGIPIAFHPSYDRDNHWRMVKPTRNYEVVAYNYNNFQPESGTYDILVKDRGYKWEMAKHFLETFDYTEYDYIGFWDDDLITDIQSINRAIEIAVDNNLKLFQLSTISGSDSTHTILHQDLSKSYSKTNFNEGMGQFVHSSLIPIILQFFKHHKVKSGWGFDLIMSSICKEKCGVIHEVSMYHPAKPSSYDKTLAHSEMHKILTWVYPNFMKDQYGESVGSFTEQKTEYEFTLKV
jgi:hypothetical protein